MGKARLLAPWVGDERVRRSAIYHCVSRVVKKQDGHTNNNDMPWRF